MKILLYQLLHLRMESHSLPLMLSILPTAERRSSAKEIGIETGVVVAKGTGTGTGTGTEIGIVVIVIALESQKTTTTIKHGGGSMNETTTINIEGMISMPNLNGMKMSIVLGIMIVKSAIGIGNPDQRGPGTEGTEETETETEETETEETGIGETGIEETGIEETE